MIARRVALAFACIVAGGVVPAPGGVAAEETISVSIDLLARPTADGGVAFTARIDCPALPGSIDLRETTAGAHQERTGASGESALSPDLVCDGVERTYSGVVSPLDEATFIRGRATASATVFACNAVGNDQVCLFAATSERIIVAGRRA